MALILGTIAVAFFMAYFYAIGLWYIGIIPLLVLLISIIYYISGISFKSRGQNIIQKYGLFLAWIVVLVGLFLALDFFNLSIIDSALSLMGLNILVRIGSYIFYYNDGKVIAQLGYYLSMIMLFISTRVLFGFESFFIIFAMVRSLTLAIIAFITFILGIKYDVEKYIYYKLFILLLGSILLSLYQKISNIYIYLLTSTLLLGFIYVYIYHILSHRPPTDNEKKEISVRRILSGERVLKSVSKDNILSNKIYTFIDQTPRFVKFFLELSNMFIILFLIYLYLQSALALQGGIEQIFYRLITAGFIINIYLLKKINYISIVQRLLTFVVINFAIYVSLFSAFQGNIGKIVFLGIIRNIFCAMSIFHIHKTKAGLYLKKIDYLFWVFTTILALVVNLVLLTQTEIVGQLLFPIVLLYVGVQGMILFYSIKYINKIKEVEVLE